MRQPRGRQHAILAATEDYMRVLLSNDDGIEAEGLSALAKALEPLGEVWVVAPRGERSAASHALTMHRPLRFREVGERRYWVDGTPADAAYVALHHLLPDPPDLVVSGINKGANLGTDTHYSGTVGAAMEGALWGFQAMAVSLHVPRGSEPNWDTAAALALRLARLLESDPLPVGTMLNVNVPDVPDDQYRGLRFAELCHHHWKPLVDVRRDHFGRTYCWIGGPHDRFSGSPESDGPLVAAGWACATPIKADWTDHRTLERLKKAAVSPARTSP